MTTDWTERYSRQILFPPIGRFGQETLAQSKVAIVGMGALGTVLANHLVRAGAGFVRIIDRDFVEASNLQRQMLYDEEDARNHLPKAIAAKAKLERINSLVQVEPVIADLNPSNAETYLADVHLILDGTDNFLTRYLINDVAVKHSIPWVYGGAVSSRGMVAVIRPKKTPCFRCLFPHPPAGRGETCDTVGVIGPVVHVVASYQAAEALKLLIGDEASVNPFLEQVELWSNETMQMDISRGRNDDCPACGHGVFAYLEPAGDQGETFTSLCGRDSVQVVPAEPKPIDLAEWKRRLEPAGKVEANAFLLRFHIDSYTLVFFKDGRVLVQGTDDPAVAKSLYARYVGH